MSRSTRVLAGVGILLLGAQLVRPAADNPPVADDVAAPPPVDGILRRACYDCHSNETSWPWYASMAPLSWLVAHDVREGREEVNFSTWNAYDARARRKKLAKSAAEVSEGKMPPWYYLLVHPEARLGEAERTALRAWTAAASPADAGTAAPR